jgi:2'-5' RNA ligase
VARLFVAVWPPEQVLDTVAALERPEIPGLKWTRREQWHVTLRFLGPVDGVSAVKTALAPAVAGVPPTEAVLGPCVGRFAQRVLHVPVSGLDAVAAGVVQATRGLGRPPEDRPFAGHLTLARVAKASRVDLRPLAGMPVEGRWVVDDVCLVESRLERSGARYQVVDRFPLLG